MPYSKKDLKQLALDYIAGVNDSYCDEVYCTPQELAKGELETFFSQVFGFDLNSEEENDYVTVDTDTTFDYDQRKFAFVQVACGKYKIFQVQDGKIGWNRYFDEEFLLHQKVKISSLFKNQ